MGKTMIELQFSFEFTEVWNCSGFTSPHSVVSIALKNWQTYNPHLKCSLLNLTN